MATLQELLSPEEQQIFQDIVNKNKKLGFASNIATPEQIGSVTDQVSAVGGITDINDDRPEFTPGTAGQGPFANIKDYQTAYRDYQDLDSAAVTPEKLGPTPAIPPSLSEHNPNIKIPMTPKAGDGNPGIFSELYGRTPAEDAAEPVKQPQVGPYNMPGAYQIYGNPPPSEEESPIPPELAGGGGGSGSISGSMSMRSPLQSLIGQYRDLASQRTTGLKEAQGAANQNAFYANLAKAANLFGAGASGMGKVTGPAKVDNTALDAIAKGANAPVEQYEQRVADEKNDPSSRYSEMLREFIKPRLEKQMGREMTKEEIANFVDTPGSVLEKIDPMLSRELIAKTREDYNRWLQSAKFEQRGKFSAKDAEQFATGLRKELTSGEIGKARTLYSQSNRAKSALEEFKRNPNGYTDYGTLMLALKNLQGDTSVVREAEIRLGKNATSLMNKAKNAIQQAMDGKSLTNQQREQIVDSLGVLSNSARDQYLRVAEPVIHHAKTQTVDLEKIISKKDFPELFEDSVQAKQTAPASGEMVKMISPTGQTKMIPKDQVEAAIKAGGKIVQ